MSRRRWQALAGAAVCLATAAGLALLAADVRAWQQAFEAGDLQYRAEPGGRRPWASPDSLPGRPAARLLDVGDDVDFRRGVRFFQLSEPALFRESFGTSPRPVAAARKLLRRAEREHDDPRVRASAANFLAVLSYQSGAFIDEVFARQAARLFRRAVRTDPTNEEAKFNLELMMYRSPESTRARRDPGGAGPSSPDSGGTGSGLRGRGY